MLWFLGFWGLGILFALEKLRGAGDLLAALLISRSASLPVCYGLSLHRLDSGHAV